MEKILRLSFANIKKHKKQTALLVLLITLCMAITSAALSGAIDINSIFPRVADELAVHKSAIFITEKYYTDGMDGLLADCGGVTAVGRVDILYSSSTKYLDTEGEEQSLYMSFITRDNERQIERSEIETTLSDEETAAIEHPIYLPYAGRESLKAKYREGDEFTVVYGTKRFPFTVAGFYESVFMPETNQGFMMIVSDSDYITLGRTVTRYKMLTFDCDPDEKCDSVFTEFNSKAEELTGRDCETNIMGITLYSQLKRMGTLYASVIVAMMLFMSAVIFAASAIMIRFRIAGDIQDQIQSIGVLEALGYTSKDITLSYTLEYLMTALAGVIAGTAAGLALLPVLHSIGMTLSGHHIDMRIAPLPILLTAAMILLFVGLIAHVRASAVKKYPPVQAFRKGIASHHFGKNRLPLKDTRGSVHLRLAMKGFFGNMKQNVGLTVCIALSATAAAAGLLLADSFGSDLKAAERMAGVEMPDITATVMNTADAYELAENISGMQGVRKTKVGSFSSDLSEWGMLYCFDRSEEMIAVCYRDFSDCESLSATEGRLPEHDNEVVITRIFSSMKGLKVGDNLTLEHDRVKKNYMICGIVTSITNGGMNVYMTEDAMKRIAPAFRPTAVEIYLEDGTDRKEFEARLTQTYGKSVSDSRKTEDGGDTPEERLRAAADKRVAEYLANHGVNHIEYSIQINGKTITGGSGGFVIKNLQSLKHVMQTQIGGYFSIISAFAWGIMIMSGVVSMIIIIALMEQAIRRQRKELGIMLGLGYTAKELMLQLAARIMPAAVFAVILGTALSSVMFKTAVNYFLGATQISIPMVIAAAVIMIMFCFASAYIGAGRIKKISVTELMTE